MRKPIEPEDEGRGHPTEDALVNYAAGRLPAADQAQLAGHLADCSICRNWLSRQSQLWAALDQWSPPPVSPSFDEQIWQRLGQPPAPGWQPAWRAAAPWIAPSRWRPIAAITVAGVLVLSVSVHAPTRQQAPGAERAATETSLLDVADIEFVEKALEDLELLWTGASGQ